MPEVLKKENGDIDWSKLFMGFAMALVFIMQQYHAMQVSDLKAVVVPRPEYTIHQDKVMDKDIILEALNRLDDRIDTIEGEKYGNKQ